MVLPNSYIFLAISFSLQCYKSSMAKVAIINSNQDIIDGIKLYLSSRGYTTVSGHVVDFKRGGQDFVKFIEENRPDIILYDIAPPYEENWNFFKIIKGSDKVKDKKFILTTTNKNALKELVGKSAIEILGKPYDLELINLAVKNAIEDQDSKHHSMSA